jgi:hypothetical protein
VVAQFKNRITLPLYLLPSADARLPTPSCGIMPKATAAACCR